MTWKTLAVPTLLKTAASQRTVAGIITPVEDRDGECCDTEGSRPYYEDRRVRMGAVTDGRNLLPLREMHGSSGQVHRSCAARGRKHLRCFRVVDNARGVEQGGIHQFFPGRPSGAEVEEGGKTWYIVDPVECSLADQPYLEVGTFAYVKANGSMELRNFRKGVQMNAEHFITAARDHDERNRPGMATMAA